MMQLKIYTTSDSWKFSQIARSFDKQVYMERIFKDHDWVV